MLALLFAYAADIALSDEWTWVPVGEHPDEPAAREVPSPGSVNQVEVALEDLAGGPTEITMVLARASSGWPRATPGNTTGATATLEVDEVVATQASANWLLGDGWIWIKRKQDEGLFVGLKLDAGTATARVSVFARKGV